MRMHTRALKPHGFLAIFQDLRTWLHVPTRIRRQPELWVHQFRHLRMGFPLSVQTDDSRLLGELVPIGVALGWSLAHALLHCHHFPWLILSCQLDLGHRRDVLRRVAEESRRGRGCRRRSDTGKLRFLVLKPAE